MVVGDTWQPADSATCPSQVLRWTKVSVDRLLGSARDESGLDFEKILRAMDQVSGRSSLQHKVFPLSVSVRVPAQQSTLLRAAQIILSPPTYAKLPFFNLPSCASSDSVGTDHDRRFP